MHATWFIASLLLYGVTPSTSTVPCPGFSKPDKIFINVVLPVPFLPKSPIITGSDSLKFTSFNMLVPSDVNDRLLTLSIVILLNKLNDFVGCHTKSFRFLKQRFNNLQAEFLFTFFNQFGSGAFSDKYTDTALLIGVTFIDQDSQSLLCSGTVNLIKLRNFCC